MHLRCEAAVQPHARSQSSGGCWPWPVELEHGSSLSTGDAVLDEELHGLADRWLLPFNTSSSGGVRSVPNMTMDGHEHGAGVDEDLRVCPIVALQQGKLHLQMPIREPLFANVSTERCGHGGFRGQNSRLVHVLRLLRVALRDSDSLRQASLRIRLCSKLQ